MTAIATFATRKSTFAGGVHPSEQKHLAAESAVEVLPAPEQVLIPLLQHIGAPCTLAVKPRTEVAPGDVVGQADGFVSAPVHASLAGATARTAMVTLPNGRHVPAVPIKAADSQPLEGDALWEDIFGGDWPTEGLDVYRPQQIADAARAAGLVGLGGAAFPTHVKLTPNEKKPIGTLLVNGCECEPYLTADYRLMIEAPGPVITGALLARRATGASKVIVCVEDNKPQAIESIRTAAAGAPVQVRVMKTKYPQGGEKQLIAAALGREVPDGGLPLDVGVVVINVGTAAALARAVVRQKPLTHRIVTVTGSGVRRPKNLLVPVGTSYRTLIDHCGGLNDETAMIIAGGPMMGFSLGSLDMPVTKGTSGITVLSAEDVWRPDETACLRCGRCVDVCPMRLLPTKLALAARAGNVELARRHHVSLCMECGCCAYVCPAGLPLVQLIRLGKVMVK